MPVHWYYTSALPRSLLGALPLAVLGIVLERRLRGWLACVIVYVAAYSLLPHKEVHIHSVDCLLVSHSTLPLQWMLCVPQTFPAVAGYAVTSRWQPDNHMHMSASEYQFVIGK